MRESKFKAFVKSNNRHQTYSGMYDIVCIDFLNKLVKVNRASVFAQQIFSFDDIELIQYTGLKDKNGKEVYEGDIIQRYGEGRYTIYWHNNTACWRMEGFTGITKSDIALACEIIGNIYENPEIV